ncbi:MAG: ankyrin repeat domain-containing protein [Vicinamibacteria bacterium]
MRKRPNPSLFIAAFACAGFGLSSSAAWAGANSLDRRLVESIKERDQKTFDMLLRAKADINSADPDGSTPLAWAVHLGQRSMALALLSAGADVRVADTYGETPLTLACANGDGVLVRGLLAKGAEPNAARWNGETAMMLAAGAGSLDAVKALAAQGGDVNASEPRMGQTPLMWAASEGQNDVIRGLVELGAKVDATSKGGFTPLVFAVIKGDAASVKTLLDKGADPNYTTPSGSKPLMIALSNGRTDAAMALLEGGALVGARDERVGNTALHLAAQQGNLAIVQALLARKADPNARTNKSAAVPAKVNGDGPRPMAGEQTPLMYAARRDHEDVMRALVAAGADPSLRAQDGSSLLMTAAVGARIKTVKYAYELDPHVDVLTDSKATVMHAAVALGFRTQPEVCEIVQFLADHQAALDEMNAAGQTPLSLADFLPVDLAVDLLTKMITERGGKPKIPSSR